MSAAHSGALVGGRLRLWWQVLRAVPRWVPAVALAALVLAGVATAMRVSGVRSDIGLVNWLPVPLVICGAIGAWLGFVDGLLRQNRANLARLVPHHAQGLREVLMLVWCGLLGLTTLGVLASGAAVLKLVVYAACLLALLAVAMRWLVMWLVLWFLLSALRPGVDRLLEAVDRHAVPEGLALLGTVLAIGVALCALIGTGGARHRRHAVQRAAWDRSFRAGGVGGGDFGWPWDQLGRLGRLPFHAAFSRAVARPDRPVWARLMLVFGPTPHAAVHAAWAALILGVGALTLLVLWVVGMFPPPSLGADQLAGPAFGVMSMALGMSMGLHPALVATRREQALAVLLPGVPRGAALNRGLAARWLVHFAVGWSLGAALVLAFVQGLAPDHLGTFVAGLVSLWPLAALLVGSLAGTSPNGAGHLARVIGLLLAGPGMFLLGLTLGLPPGLVGSAIGGLSLAWIAWRWWVLGRAPSAFPAGRLA